VLEGVDDERIPSTRENRPSGVSTALRASRTGRPWKLPETGVVITTSRLGSPAEPGLVGEVPEQRFSGMRPPSA